MRILAKLGCESPAQESAGHAWRGPVLIYKPNLMASWAPDERLTVCLHDSTYACSFSYKPGMDYTADAPEKYHRFFPIQQQSRDQLTSAPTPRRGLASPSSASTYTRMNRARRTCNSAPNHGKFQRVRGFGKFCSWRSELVNHFGI